MIPNDDEMTCAIIPWNGDNVNLNNLAISELSSLLSLRLCPYMFHNVKISFSQVNSIHDFMVLSSYNYSNRF